MVHWKICSLLFIGYLLKGLVVASQASNLGDLAKILAQLAGGENCAFRCPKGKRVLGCSKNLTEQLRVNFISSVSPFLHQKKKSTFSLLISDLSTPRKTNFAF